MELKENLLGNYKENKRIKRSHVKNKGFIKIIKKYP